MPDPEQKLKQQQVNQEPLFVHQDQEEDVAINAPGEMQQLVGQAEQALALEAMQDLPLLVHKNVEALNAYIKERASKGWASNYDQYRKLAEKLTLQANTQGKKVKQSEWDRLEEEAAQALEKVQQSDAAQQKIMESASFPAFDDEIDALLKDCNKVTDSSAYKALRKVAQAYKDETDFDKKMEIMKELKKQALSYATLRHKTSYATKKGKRRMDRVTGMIAMMDKLIDGGELISLATKQRKMAAQIINELAENHLVDVKAAKAKKTTIIERWGMAMLPYEIGKDGKVTPETAANYDENMELIEAFKTNDKKRKKHMILKIYKRLNLPDYGKMPLTKENAVKCYKESLKQKGLQTNLLILSDLCVSEYDGTNPDPELQYISERVEDKVTQGMNNVATAYINSLGYTEEGKPIGKQAFSPEGGQKIMDFILEDIKMTFEQKEKFGSGHYAPANEEMEQRIENTINEYQNSKEYKEDCVPDSKEYIEKTLKIMVDNTTKQDQLQGTYLHESHVKECHDHRFWNQPERLSQLLLDEEKGENKELTERGKQNTKYNEKMMKLLNSEDATDRTAALASCYLRRYRGRLSKLELNEKGLNRYIRNGLNIKGFWGIYNSLEDFVKCEHERHEGNELVDYMYKNIRSVKMSVVTACTAFVFQSRGYNDITGDKLNEDYTERGKMLFENILGYYDSEYEKEKAANNGQYIQEDMEMIHKLEELCKSKGILV